jgi:uncharacterized protein YcbK (DUF882 family)
MAEPKNYQYFTAEELACKCKHADCPKHGMDEAFMDFIIVLRERMFPFVVASAYRCPRHNEEVSTTGKTGPHTTGKAMDIRIDGTAARLLLNAAVRYGCEGIGIQQQGPRGRRFIHLDMVERPEGPVVWSY